MHGTVNGRERLNAVLAKRPTDRLAWSTLVDGPTLALAPPELRGNHGLDFYRHLGCDILMLNGWNTPHGLKSPTLCWPDGVQISSQADGPRTVTEWQTPHGTLTAVRHGSHPTKYPVDSIEAVRVYREMWDGATYEAHDDTDALAALDALIGDDGVVTRFWGPTTIPRLLELDMGTESFYYLRHDHPAEMDGLIRLMHERELVAYRHLADGPWASVNLCENTSTYYISPQIYADYNMPHQRDFVAMMKAAGKTAIIHMCGHVRGVLELIRETGCDGIHFLTPPPTGDTPWEMALDVIGEDLIIFGCIDPSVFVSGDVAQIGPELDQLITPRLRDANFVLHPTADGIPVELERFEAVARWVEANG